MTLKNAAPRHRSLASLPTFPGTFNARKPIPAHRRPTPYFQVEVHHHQQVQQQLQLTSNTLCCGLTGDFKVSGKHSPARSQPPPCCSDGADFPKVGGRRRSKPPWWKVQRKASYQRVEAGFCKICKYTNPAPARPVIIIFAALATTSSDRTKSPILEGFPNCTHSLQRRVVMS